MAKVRLTDSTFCAGAAALAVDSIRNDMLLPVLQQLDGIGLNAIEAFGGTMFESCVSTVFEDPWERLRLTRSALKKTPLQMDFYGQNALGYKNFPDDTVEYFIKKAIDNGVDIISATDPLNDMRNLESTLRAAARGNVKVIAGIACMPDASMTSDVFVLYAKQLEEMGASAVSVRDYAGTLRPYDAYQLIKALKGALSPSTEVHLRTFCLSGIGMLTALKAAEAGVDVIDTALSPFAMGASLPATEALVATFDGTPYTTDLPLEAFGKAVEKLTAIRLYLEKEHKISPRTQMTDSENFRHMLPANLASSFDANLKNARIENRRAEVCAEIEKIRSETGMPPLLSPIADILVAQAILNVLSDKRYTTLTREFRALVHGEYGRTPADIAPTFRNSICGTPTGIDFRPADHMEPLIEKIRDKVAPYAEQEEDVLTYAMFDKRATDFFEARKIRKYNLDKYADFQNKIHNI